MRIITEDDFQVQIGDIKLYKCPGCDVGGIKDYYRFCYNCGDVLSFNLKER